MDALSTVSHRTLTDNGASAYNSTLSPTLDAFHKLTRHSSATQIHQLLNEAWAEDPETALKIIWNLRSIHEGKSEKEAFYMAFGWLYDNHPRTAISNLQQLVDPVISKRDQESGLAHGYWKDLLNILALATVDELRELPKPVNFLHSRAAGHRRMREPRKEVEYDLKPIIKARRMSIGVANQERVVRKLQSDPKYRALYIAVARLFAERLIADFKFLLEADAAQSQEAKNAALRRISLAPKWAPSLLGAHDRRTSIATPIARLFYHARDALPQYSFPSALKTSERLDDAEPTVIMRSFYRRWLLSPLRAASKITERLMSANQWKDISYSRVSSVCMRNNKQNFFKHDPEGFQKYLISVEKGERSISGATLLPHELLLELVRLVRPTLDTNARKYPDLQKHREALAASQIRVVEAQWNTLVNNLRDSGRLENSLAICDVSGSMGTFGYDASYTQPIYPALALSLILSRLAKPPFSQGFITFSASPEFVRLKEDLSLYDTISTMTRSAWGMNTDLEKVFLGLILPLAKQHKVSNGDMIKRLFIFSDMQFDQGTVQYYCPGETPWETNYDRIERAFKDAGYDTPEIVYWNLSDGHTVEVQKDRKGVALLSGFSPSMLKVFMGEEEPAAQDAETLAQDKTEKIKEEFNPLNIMKKALSRPSFDGLLVLD
ncbi:hypothetical protein C8F01DRAFT_990941 [Mycena amicta]|nr:hypothetical protein C8F01DRAFT_990941 [Mycena amicta]